VGRIRGDEALGRRNVSSGGVYEDVYGYSRAVRVGEHVHVSGTTARDPYLDGCDAYQQAKAALEIIDMALVDAGSSLDAVVRTVTYVTDMADAALVARAHREAFGEVRPAATLVGVAALIDPRMKVEIEAYAIEAGSGGDSSAHPV
jgi:enamine deaminase RidA (YjgF/YER057c/UK114 family)